MSSPTDEEILCVKTNLRNLIDFNNLLYVEGNTEILNAYFLLTLTDNKDLGLEIGLNLQKGAFIALGSEMGPAGIISANFMCGLLDSYLYDTPASLNAVLSSMLLRFQKTSEQINIDLETYYDNPVQYWDKIFSGSVTNAFGTYQVSAKLSDLSTINFPSQTDTMFMDYMLVAQYIYIYT